LSRVHVLIIAAKPRYADPYVSLKPGIGSFFGNRSFVLHFANTTRLACANFSSVNMDLNAPGGGFPFPGAPLPSGGMPGLPAPSGGAPPGFPGSPSGVPPGFPSTLPSGAPSGVPFPSGGGGGGGTGVPPGFPSAVPSGAPFPSGAPPASVQPSALPTDTIVPGLPPLPSTISSGPPKSKVTAASAAKAESQMSNGGTTVGASMTGAVSMFFGALVFLWFGVVVFPF
jgi:hypothetical protein